MALASCLRLLDRDRITGTVDDGELGVSNTHLNARAWARSTTLLPSAHTT